MADNSDKPYDYLLKFLLVGDSDVGKSEIMEKLSDAASENLFLTSDVSFKTTTVLVEGRKIKLYLWDTSGQGRLCTIYRSYSRGAQGVILVFDITSKWSFEGIDRWLMEIEQHAPGIPKILVGNRLHLAFKRQVSTVEARDYSAKHNMPYFEVSPLCDFNVTESLVELAQLAMNRHGLRSIWRLNKSVLGLQELCCREIVRHVTFLDITCLPLPTSLLHLLRSYSVCRDTQLVHHSRCGAISTDKRNKKPKRSRKSRHKSDIVPLANKDYSNTFDKCKIT